MENWFSDSLLTFLALGAGIASALAIHALTRRFRRIWIAYFLLLAFLAFCLGIIARDGRLASATGLLQLVWSHHYFFIRTFLFAGLFVLLGLNWPRRQSRLLISALGVIVVLHLGILPGTGWLLVRDHWRSSRTLIDESGVCMQSTSWSCGPAAAVTGLAQLGIATSEASLARKARTSPFSGTPPVNLMQAIEAEGSGRDRVRCRLMLMESIDEIPLDYPTIAMVRHSLMAHHYVVILAIGDDQVVIADPEKGLQIMSRDSFMARFMGMIIQLSRINPNNIA